jgi:predicted dehydrogenase
MHQHRTDLEGVAFRRFRRANEQLNVAVVGYGYWGPNLVRNVMERPSLNLMALCERDQARGEAFSLRVPGVPVISDLDQLLQDDELDAVIVATPPASHHPIVRACLQAGKHVLVEKPLARTTAEAHDLAAIARANGLLLMPGHTFLYSPAVTKIRDLIRDDVLGEVYFVTSSRMNLGKYQSDGVICDLAPHDLSILRYWLDEPLSTVAASARSVFQADVPETAFLTLGFESGAAANVQVSWLAPSKMRQMVVVGSRRMVVYDDTLSDTPVRIYDRGMEFSTPESFGTYQLTYRSGDVVAPCLEAAEPLALELDDFAQCIRSGDTPRSHLQLGVDVVEAMEAAEASLRRRGEPVILAAAEERAVA